MRGFTLFFAMLVAALALSVGLAIYDLTVREIDLSATATQSEYAIYAADTGVECALYWDIKGYSGNGGSAFATSSSDTQYPASNIFCNSQDVAKNAVANGTWPLSTVNSAATTTFTITFSSEPYCTTVVVAKNGFPSQTTVTAYGYNNCQGGGLQLERSLQVTY